MRDEGATSVADVLVRRTRVALETADAGRAAVGKVAEILAQELGWDDQTRNQAVQDFETDWPDTWLSVTE